MHAMTTASWLSVYADKVIEVGWLAALILAPLFFNPYASQVFEPNKVALVRTLALVMLAAWLVRGIEAYAPRVDGADPGTARPQLRRLLIRLRALYTKGASENPLLLPMLFVIVAHVVSTLASVAPTLSWLGSYERSQGLYTTLSYVSIALV